MVKLIFSDFDKTLVDRSVDKKNIIDYKLNILRKLKNNQIIFSIVSGRCLSFFKENYLELMDVVSYFISSNGSSIYDTCHGVYIYCNFIESDDLKRVYDVAKKYNLSVYFNLLEKFIYVDKEKYQYFNFEQMRCEQVVLIGNVNNYDSLVCDIEQIDHIVINNKGINPDSGSFFFDINQKGVSKGKAICYLYDYLNLKKEDAICFGDNDNDMSMFQVVGTKIAVGNAKETVKSRADVVIGSVWEDSVFKYINEISSKKEKL